MAPSASWNNDLNCRRMCAQYGSQRGKCRSSPIACVLHSVHRRNCRGTIGLASLPCSTGKEQEPIRNCINNCNLEYLERGMRLSNNGSKPNWPRRKNHAKYVHSLAPLDGASLGDTCRPSQTLRCCPSMFAWKPNEFKATTPEDENGEGIPRPAHCLTMPAAQLPHIGCCWAAEMLSLRMST